MGAINDAILGLKTALATIDPTPQPTPTVYAWPDDYATLDFTTFPFVIVAQVVNRPFAFSDMAHGVLNHFWLAEINICLAQGPLTRIAAAQEAETKHEPWILALAKVLSADRSLGGNALLIGTERQLFSYRVGHIGWDKAKAFWGIRAEVQVMQDHSATVS